MSVIYSFVSILYFYYAELSGDLVSNMNLLKKAKEGNVTLSEKEQRSVINFVSNVFSTNGIVHK